MSWPTDGLPRFKVGSVSGYGGATTTTARELTLYSVLDRAYNHEAVWQENALDRSYRRGYVYAHALAARLEAEHAQ